MKKSLWILFFCLLHLSLVSQVHIILEEIPDNTPKDAKIYLASSINQWKPNDVNYIFKKQSNNLYSLTLNEVKLPIEFKLTLGSWHTVEMNAEYEDIPNREITKVVDTIFISIENWKNPEKKTIPKSTASSNVKRLDKTFTIEALGRERNIWIYLPPDYEKTQKSYPVIYMQDGQNIFDNMTSYAGEWKVDELLNQLFEETGKGFIVVAIEHGKEFRIEEYQPWQHKDYGVGKGEEYVDFLAKKIKPFVDKNYRTLPEAHNTVIMGSSVGGIISFYACIKHPDIFGKGGIFSPSFWIAEPYLKEFINNFEGRFKPKMYMIVGMQEGKMMYELSEEIFNHLQGKEFKNTTFVKKEEGKHTESFWSAEFLQTINYLFPKYELYEEENKVGKLLTIQSIPNNQKLFFRYNNKKNKLKLIIKKDDKVILSKKWEQSTEINLKTLENSSYKILIQSKKEVIYQTKLRIH